MDDRQWLAPEALAVLDGGPVPRRDAEGNYTDWLGWRAAGRPLLSPRARALKEAVEAAMAICDSCPRTQGQLQNAGSNGKPMVQPCSSCPLASIRRAYLGTTTAPAVMGLTREEFERETRCEKCQGTERVKCPLWNKGDGCPSPDSIQPCPQMPIQLAQSACRPCTIPCDCAKGEGR